MFSEIDEVIKTRFRVKQIGKKFYPQKSNFLGVVWLNFTEIKDVSPTGHDYTEVVRFDTLDEAKEFLKGESEEDSIIHPFP